MRAVFIGASSLAILTAKLLVKRGHEIVIVEKNKERIDDLAQLLDCGIINGDGSKPAILKETDPPNTDILFCLTGDDQANILASLVGRSLGFKRVVTKIEDPELEHVCIELGLEDTIIPSRTIGRFLADKCEGRDPLELSTMIREEARVFSFVLAEDYPGGIDALDLHKTARVVCIYRQDKLIIPDNETKLLTDDEVVVIAHYDAIEGLKERWVG